MTMKIIPLLRHSKNYSCNSYLILGDWNRPDDINTIIDPGCDDFVIQEIERLSTGFGKIRVAQVILTHSHFNHSGAIKAVKNYFKARALAFCIGAEIDVQLSDGQFVKAGDEILEVLSTPGHSSDSICLYAPSEKTLFAGDTRIQMRLPGDIYSLECVEGLFKIACRDIQKIYFGHDSPVLNDCQEMIQNTLRNIHRKQFIPITARGG